MSQCSRRRQSTRSTLSKPTSTAGWTVHADAERPSGDVNVLSHAHGDHRERVDLVEAVDPEQVYVQHGSVDAFASYLTNKMPYRAQSLQQNQTTLGDF